MKIGGVVLATRDVLGLCLVPPLYRTFRTIHVVCSYYELHDTIKTLHPDAAIVDIELVTLSKINKLARLFPNVRFVCLHRFATENMWAEALHAGAADLCFPDDVAGIIAALTRDAPISCTAA